jgi:hypothetical protein
MKRHGYEVRSTRFGWRVSIWCAAYSDSSPEDTIAIGVEGSPTWVFGSQARAERRAQRALARHMRWQHENARKRVEL